MPLLETLWVTRRVLRDADSRRKACVTPFTVLLPLSTIPSVDADPCGLFDLWLGVADLVPVRTRPSGGSEVAFFRPARAFSLSWSGLSSSLMCLPSLPSLAFKDCSSNCSKLRLCLSRARVKALVCLVSFLSAFLYRRYALSFASRVFFSFDLIIGIMSVVLVQQSLL